MTRSFRTVLTIFIAILMTSLLAACGTTATPIPTATTVPAGMQSMNVTDGLGGTLTLSIPTGLKIETDSSTGLLTMVTDGIALDQPTPFKPGQWGLAVGATPLSLVQAVIPPGQTATPQLIIDALKQSTMQTVAQVSFGASEATTVGGRTAGRVTATSPQGDVELLAVDLTNSYLVMTLFTATGERAAHEAILTEIANSAVYTPKQ